jgi:hypothetical protein
VNQIWTLNLKVMTLVITYTMEMQSNHSAQGFSRMTSIAKNGFNMCGVEDEFFMCPMCIKSVKL